MAGIRKHSFVKEEIMNRKVLIAETIGTFALIFIGAGTGALGVGGLVGVALAHGLILIAIAYTFGPISGAHINPAVTFAVALSGKMSWREAINYWIVQFIGAGLGAAALFFIFGGSSNGLGATLPANGVSDAQTIFLEALLTFLLVTTIFRTALAKESNQMAGLAIGLTLTAAILMGGPLTGASLNPARTFGPALFTGTLDQLWLYIVGPIAGASAAVFVNRWLD